MNLFLNFLETHESTFLSLHILGVALGLGGATISDLLFFKFLKDYRISQKEHEVLHVLKSVVLGALGLIIVSGLALYWPNASTRIHPSNAPPGFLVKK